PGLPARPRRRALVPPRPSPGPAAPLAARQAALDQRRGPVGTPEPPALPDRSALRAPRRGESPHPAARSPTSPNRLRSETGLTPRPESRRSLALPLHRPWRTREDFGTEPGNADVDAHEGGPGHDGIQGDAITTPPRGSAGVGDPRRLRFHGAGAPTPGG